MEKQSGPSLGNTSLSSPQKQKRENCLSLERGIKFASDFNFEFGHDVRQLKLNGVMEKPSHEMETMMSGRSNGEKLCADTSQVEYRP